MIPQARQSINFRHLTKGALLSRLFVDFASLCGYLRLTARAAVVFMYQPERPMDSCSSSGLASVFCEMLRSRQTSRTSSDHPACLRLRGARM